MKNKQRGFIPLIAIIVLGVGVITGGIITSVKIHDNKKEEVIINNESITQENKSQIVNNSEKTEIKNTNLVKEKTIVENEDNKITEDKIVVLVSPAIKIIDDFLLNQTSENLKEFCNKAKTVSGTGKLIEVLNSDRTDYIKRPITLYEQIKVCNSSKYDNYIWAQYSQKYLMALSDSDNDKVRKDKINFNNRIKNLNNGALIGYINYENLNMTPDQILNNKLEQKVYPGEESAFQSEYELILMQISMSLVIPEVELKSFTLDFTTDICKQIETIEIPKTKSLIGDIKLLCKKVAEKKFEDKEEIDYLVRSINEKWGLWQKSEELNNKTR